MTERARAFAATQVFFGGTFLPVNSNFKLICKKNSQVNMLQNHFHKAIYMRASKYPLFTYFPEAAASFFLNN